VHDLGGEFDDYNSSQTPEIADRIAAASDWSIVGRDLREAMDAARDGVGVGETKE